MMVQHVEMVILPLSPICCITTLSDMCVNFSAVNILGNVKNCLLTLPG